MSVVLLEQSSRPIHCHSRAIVLGLQPRCVSRLPSYRCYLVCVTLGHWIAELSVYECAQVCVHMFLNIYTCASLHVFMCVPLHVVTAPSMPHFPSQQSAINMTAYCRLQNRSFYTMWDQAAQLCILPDRRTVLNFVLSDLYFHKRCFSNFCLYGENYWIFDPEYFLESIFPWFSSFYNVGRNVLLCDHHFKYMPLNFTKKKFLKMVLFKIYAHDYYYYFIELSLLLSLLLHFDADLKHFMVHGLFDSISSKSVFQHYQFSIIILPWIAMACINLFSELMNSGLGSLATASDPCKWKRKKKLKGWHAGFKPAKDIRFQRM